ncbi:hypothetical protein ACFWPK_17825 [Nocardia sp. NPDC058519]|uniref:hypothetical protein n=1 Tax=Nocardia sp. NPDC058519 TaxID=3346535 RepID=UPI003660A639
MNITPATICDIRGCTNPATHLAESEWQKRTYTYAYCPTHHRHFLTSNRSLAALDC